MRIRRICMAMPRWVGWRAPARLAKLVDATDLKSVGPLSGRPGSSPGAGTIYCILRRLSRQRDRSGTRPTTSIRVLLDRHAHRTRRPPSWGDRRRARAGVAARASVRDQRHLGMPAGAASRLQILPRPSQQRDLKPHQLPADFANLTSSGACSSLAFPQVSTSSPRDRSISGAY